MNVPPTLAQQLGAELGRVDWLRVIHRGAVLFRALRGDADAAADDATERARAGKLRSTVDGVARAAVGCLAPAPCGCPICSEGTVPP